MEWMVINTLQMHSTFASLGSQVGDTYVVNENCLATLNEIFNKLLIEDRTLRTFRRALGFSQTIKKDLIPLLINVKDDTKIIDTTIRILVNLMTPIECLLPTEIMFKTDAGRNTIFELNNLLVAGKSAFNDPRSTRAVVDYMKKLIEKEKKLSMEECETINNCLLLLRNILHIPETWSNATASCSLQNKILWNLFSHSIDKVLIHLITCDQKDFWAITIVQLVALMYKDQHVLTLQKLLNQWFETSLSESSEDNESNTSPPHQRSEGDSSPMLTSDPTSDSSDTGGSNKDESSSSRPNCGKADKDHPDVASNKQAPVPHFKIMPSHFEGSKTGIKHTVCGKKKAQNCTGTSRKPSTGKGLSKKERTSDLDSQSSSHHSLTDIQVTSKQGHHMHKTDSMSEPSDCGYGTQIENQESFSTSSNEDENVQQKRPVHQKPHSSHKIRSSNSKPLIGTQEKREWRRKKLVRRSRTTLVNMKAMTHYVPTEEDISNLLKEFTVDFLLKGYGCLVHELHRQLLLPKVNLLEMDTSHFFWLVTYFLKFAMQLELDLELISPILSFDIISYLTYEGVNLCEQLEILSLQQDGDRKMCLRRMHLVVTAIRELLQAVDCFKKMSHLSSEDREFLLNLQMQIGSTEDLKCLFVLLLRQYNDSLHSRQYLQDLVITNHILLLFLDNSSKLPKLKGELSMMEHIKQFANAEIMQRYGMLLENFRNNGEFINNCIFTMMHHISGDLDQPSALFQPSILKIFTQIWESDFEVCDDWTDLIEYIIKKFVKSPNQKVMLFEVTQDSLDQSSDGDMQWTKEETDNLYWHYVQNASDPDPVGKVMRLYSENGVTNKTRVGIIQQLFTQDAISRSQYDEFMKRETLKSAAKLDKRSSCSSVATNGSVSEMDDEDTKDDLTNMVPALTENLLKEGKGKYLRWLQKLLVESCYVKLCNSTKSATNKDHVMEPIPHIYTVLGQSIPIVPWNSDQKAILLEPSFILLLHKLGIHLMTDSGKLFPRIPSFWTPIMMFDAAQKLGTVDTCIMKFDVKLLHSCKRKCSSGDVSPTASENPMTHSQFLIPTVKQVSTPTIQFTPKPESAMNWLEIVTKSHAKMLQDSPSTSSLLQINKNVSSASYTYASRSNEPKSIPTLIEVNNKPQISSRSSPGKKCMKIV